MEELRESGEQSLLITKPILKTNKQQQKPTPKQTNQTDYSEIHFQNR